MRTGSGEVEAAVVELVVVLEAGFTGYNIRRETFGLQATSELDLY